MRCHRGAGRPIAGDSYRFDAGRPSNHVDGEIETQLPAQPLRDPLAFILDGGAGGGEEPRRRRWSGPSCQVPERFHIRG